MLRYKTETRPGLVALYDIRPGNGAGQFLQPRSPHGAIISGGGDQRGYQYIFQDFCFRGVSQTSWGYKISGSAIRHDWSWST